jgi:hypothetical protein
MRKYIYIFFLFISVAASSQAQGIGGFFSKIKQVFVPASELKIGNFTFKDGSTYTGELQKRQTLW